MRTSHGSNGVTRADVPSTRRGVARRPKARARAPLAARPSIDSIYYAHAMPLYGTKTEQAELAVVSKHFRGVEIVDPGTFQNNPEKRAGGMAYCLRLVDSCEALAFSKFRGHVTAGVGKEVNHAIKGKKPVFEIVDGSVRPRVRPVDHLSVGQTLDLYWTRTSL